MWLGLFIINNNTWVNYSINILWFTFLIQSIQTSTRLQAVYSGSSRIRNTLFCHRIWFQFKYLLYKKKKNKKSGEKNISVILLWVVNGWLRLINSLKTIIWGNRNENPNNMYCTSEFPPVTIKLKALNIF